MPAYVVKWREESKWFAEQYKEHAAMSKRKTPERLLRRIDSIIAHAVRLIDRLEREPARPEVAEVIGDLDAAMQWALLEQTRPGFAEQIEQQSQAVKRAAAKEPNP